MNVDQDPGARERPQDVADRQALPHTLLGGAFEAVPNGLLLVDAGATIVAANAALLRMFGFQSADVIGKPLELFVPISHGEILQGFSSSLSASERRATGGGRELQVRHASGREFPVEVSLNPMATAQSAMILASVVDTSLRRSLETAFGRIFESATQGMVLVDAEGRMAILNERLASMLGYAHADLVGRSLEILLPQRYRAHHRSLMFSYRETPSTRSMGGGRDLTALHASGAELPVEIGLSEVHWQDQQMTLATVVDISVRRHIEMELKQANENLREFTRVASHDLKSPLRGIADLVGWVREDLGDDPPPGVVRNLDRITDRISRLERLITDLLRYARSEQVDADCTLIDFTAMVRDILRMDPVPDGFSVNIAVDAAPISAPRTPIEIVLRNLIATP